MELLLDGPCWARFFAPTDASRSCRRRAPFMPAGVGEQREAVAQRFVCLCLQFSRLVVGVPGAVLKLQTTSAKYVRIGVL